MIYSTFHVLISKEEYMENSHISALQAKHAGLDERIRAESSRPLPDATLLAQLKKRKLRIKEEMKAR